MQTQRPITNTASHCHTGPTAPRPAGHQHLQRAQLGRRATRRLSYAWAGGGGRRRWPRRPRGRERGVRAAGWEGRVQAGRAGPEERSPHGLHEPARAWPTETQPSRRPVPRIGWGAGAHGHAWLAWLAWLGAYTLATAPQSRPGVPRRSPPQGQRPPVLGAIGRGRTNQGRRHTWQRGAQPRQAPADWAHRSPTGVDERDGAGPAPLGASRALLTGPPPGPEVPPALWRAGRVAEREGWRHWGVRSCLRARL